MWDSFGMKTQGDVQKGNFSQLRKEIWKDYIVRELAFSNNAYGRDIGAFNQFSIDINHLPLRELPFASHIYNDLQSQIHDLQMQQANIQSELQMATEHQMKTQGFFDCTTCRGADTIFTKFEELQQLDYHLILSPGTCTINRKFRFPNTWPSSDPRIYHINPRTTCIGTWVVTPAGSELVTLTPDSKSPKGGIFTRATNRVKGWGNKLSKHRASD
ncbi:hypothetical protein BJ165DRAFT_1409814 [Panaeolus papilionaceus]|nr:hypothetical protein BJ165DRAFT_1409814 [Panaeolus papilionaceus]